MAAEMIQNVVEILDSAHHYRYELAEVIDGIQSLQDQINASSDVAQKQVEEHFTNLKTTFLEAMDRRLLQLQGEIESIRESAMKPLEECRALVDENLKSTAQVMDEGASILSGNPEKNSDKLIKFKENPKTKALSSVPAIPSSSEVACVNVVLSPELGKQIETAISVEGHVLTRAPVQITDVIEKPGSLLVQWAEIDEEDEMIEFWLQYSLGSYKGLDNPNAVFHTAYVGTSTNFMVKHLRTHTAYTLRVCGRGESDTPWSAWSVHRVASTTIESYKWAPSENKVYSLSNEDKTATRSSEGVSHVLYSSKASFLLGNTLTMKVLDDADKSPGDGLCISRHNKDTETFSQEGVIFVNLYGSVFVEGQEMKVKLPEIKKGSIVAFQTESLPNGKVRVSVQNEDKEVTFDWKSEAANAPSLLSTGLGAGDPGAERTVFFFGIKFSQEHWKIAVD